MFNVAVYSITWNGLPQQKNYSDQYKMFVSGVCTVPQPKCDWSIKVCVKKKGKSFSLMSEMYPCSKLESD